MRTPTWEASPGALAALLHEFGPLIKADAWTVTLTDGTVLRWAGGDVPLTLGSRAFALGPGITRGQCRWRVGISTDTLSMTLADITGEPVVGMSLAELVRSRLFAGAQVQLERVFTRPGDAGPAGALLWFLGDVDEVEGDRVEAAITVVSFTKRLEVAVPRGVYQPLCLNELGDARCGIVRPSVTATATSASTALRTAFGHSLAQPTGWGTLGIITFTGGANAGHRRTCKLHTATELVALQPWQFPVAAGDAYRLDAGCARDQSTCTNKFNNLARFRGQPYIPVPETVL